jgi:phosphoribosylaminoimidazolecarboxamide formyltransferase / IMP cyclohydrolase
MRSSGRGSASPASGNRRIRPGIEAFGAEILSADKTAAPLPKSGIPATGLPDYRGFPEMTDGRFESLHRKIHGGLPGVRDNERPGIVMVFKGVRCIMP